MTKDHYIKLKHSNSFLGAIQFLNILHGHYNIPLEFLDVNDWQCNLKPAVYIHNIENRFKMRKYCRWSHYDIKNALKFYERGKK